jgi:hypothetical protein
MTTATAPATTLNIGSTVPVGTALVNLIIMAILTDVNNPNMFGATMQGFQSEAVLTVPALQGKQGNPGQPSFALRFQDQILASTDDLPTDLTNAPTDLGKYWVFPVNDQNGNVIALVMQVWYGTALGWQEFPVGMPGPVGPYPLITPNIVLEIPGNASGPGGVDSWIQVEGTASNPTFTFHIAAPQGLVGPQASLDSCPDVDLSTHAPQPGDQLVCSSRITPGAPSTLTINPLGTGGSFAAGEYFWEVTALLANGDETLPSNEVGTTFVGTTSSVVLAWSAPGGGGAVGYRIYRGTSASHLSVLVTQINSGTTTTFTDTGAAGTPGSAPSAGIVAGRTIWTSQTVVEVLPQLFTIPQSAFSSIQGIGASTQPICTFALPQQPWPWKPYVSGQMQIFGLSISLSPLLVGANVLLGGATTGTQVAAGTGNNFGVVNVLPNPASAQNPSVAMTPTNRIGLVQANHIGQQGTLFINLVQQGMAGTYDFNNEGAELTVLVLPMPGAALSAVL